MEGNPEAAAPRAAQEPANKRQTAGEHPGPEPVAAGRGKGGDGANVESGKGSGGKEPADASAESGGSRSKDVMEAHQREESGAAGGAPMMAKGSQQGKDGESEREDVKRHNEEFEKRGNRENTQREGEREDDAVSTGFWQGESTKDSYQSGGYGQQRRGFWNRGRGFFVLPLPFGFVLNVRKHDGEREERNRRRGQGNGYGDEVEREKQIEDAVVGDVYYEAQ